MMTSALGLLSLALSLMDIHLVAEGSNISEVEKSSHSDACSDCAFEGVSLIREKVPASAMPDIHKQAVLTSFIDPDIYSPHFVGTERNQKSKQNATLIGTSNSSIRRTKMEPELELKPVAYSAKDMMLREALVKMAKAVEVEKVAKGKACAVVSSSADLLDHSDGATIDGYEVVARINFPALTGFSTNVGKKTSIMFTGWPSFCNENKYTHQLDHQSHIDQYGKETHIVLSDMECSSDKAREALARRVFKSIPNEMGSCTRAVGRCKAEGFRSCAQIPPDELGAFLGKDYIPTTGFLGVNLLSVSCRCVKLFGFGTEKVSSGHYWEPWADKSEWHSLQKEHADLQKFATPC